MLKFKTKQNDGLLFYATDKDQTAGISLALSDGHLKLISQRQEIISADKNFNDSEWHVVSVTHNNEKLILSYDDYAISGLVFYLHSKMINILFGKHIILSLLNANFNYKHYFSSDSIPPPLHILYGDMFIGSLPRNYVAEKGTVASTEAFNGCIGDATLNDNVMNFANYSDLHGGVLGKCLLDPKIGSDTDVHTGKSKMSV